MHVTLTPWNTPHIPHTQVKSTLIQDTLKSLGQTTADKAAFFENENRALAERLYAPSASVFGAPRRPLSALPRRRQLHVSIERLYY